MMPGRPSSAARNMAVKDAKMNWFREFAVRHVINRIRMTAIVNNITSDRNFSGHDIYKKDKKDTGITKNGKRVWIKANDYPKGVPIKVGEEIDVDGEKFEIISLHKIFDAFLVIDIAGFTE
ncbi:MAG: hypothetical protein LBQ97_02595 [Fusobacteriaceae bacterium]|jgi:hypothetical protein|nr:hypothetical protein [Fusobacteriaceae bacterium]